MSNPSDYVAHIGEYVAVFARSENVRSELSITVGNQTASNSGNENEPYVYLVLNDRVNYYTPYILEFDGNQVSGIVQNPIDRGWDWNADTSFGSTEVFLALSENALNNKGHVSDFSYRTWNDLCLKTYNLRRLRLKYWDTRYLSLEDTLMKIDDRTLTAARFNSLRFNIGEIESTGIADKVPGNPVLSADFFTIIDCINAAAN